MMILRWKHSLRLPPFVVILNEKSYINAKIYINSATIFVTKFYL